MAKRLFFSFLISLCFSLGLRAQLSIEHAPETLLPIEPLSYFASTNTPPPALNEVMLSNTDSKEQLPPSLNALKYEPHLAFFCRVEVKIDKAVGTPFRFRLGSVDYVDYLEGKRSSY